MKKKLFAVVLAATMVLGCASTAMADVELTEPVIYYDFENGLDNSGSATAADATIVGGGALATDSERGQVFNNVTGSASGKKTDYLKLPTTISDNINDMTELTVSMWVKSPTANNEVADNGAIGAGWSPLFSMCQVGVDWTYTLMTLRGTIHVNFDGYFDANADNDYSDYLADNQWHYVTYVITETAATTYVDGVVKNTITRTDECDFFNKTYDNIAVGGYALIWDDADSHVLIDDVAIYNTALSADEISYIVSNDVNNMTFGSGNDGAGSGNDGAGSGNNGSGSGNNGGGTTNGGKNPTGDATTVALFAAVAALAAVVVLKKRTVTE